MRTIKLAIVLPAVFTGIEGILWYWDLHSQPLVASYLGKVSPSIPISNGVDFPATLLNLLMTSLVGTILGHPIVCTLVHRLVFLLCVAGSWCLIGCWLDYRAKRDGQRRPVKLRPWIAACQLAVLAFGVFTLLFSFHVHPFSFPEVTERALLQIWAAFLIAVPVLGIMYPTADNSRDEYPAESGHRPRRCITNFRGFMIALGLFAGLLIFGVVTSPQVLK
jgi:hypothetical protein